MNKKWTDWEWGDTGMALLVLAGIGALVLGIIAVIADHSPRFYYIEHSGQQGATLPCVRAWQEWYPNGVMFCSDDVTKTVDVMNRMNAALPKHR